VNDVGTSPSFLLSSFLLSGFGFHLQEVSWNLLFSFSLWPVAAVAVAAAAAAAVAAPVFFFFFSLLGPFTN